MRIMTFKLASIIDHVDESNLEIALCVCLLTKMTLKVLQFSSLKNHISATAQHYFFVVAVKERLESLLFYEHYLIFIQKYVPPT